MGRKPGHARGGESGHGREWAQQSLAVHSSLEFDISTITALRNDGYIFLNKTLIRNLTYVLVENPPKQEWTEDACPPCTCLHRGPPCWMDEDVGVGPVEKNGKEAGAAFYTAR